MTETTADMPAQAATAPARPAPAEQDRTISPVAGRFGLGKSGKAVTVGALAIGCGVFMAATWRHGPPKPIAAPVESARQVVAFEPAQADPPKAGPTLANPGPNAPVLDASQPAGVGSQGSAAQAGAQPTSVAVAAPSAQSQAALQAQAEGQARAMQAQAIRSAPILAFSQSGALEPIRGAAPAVERVEAAAPTELDQLRHGSVVGLARATRLPDRNFLITAGTSIPCTLQTAMDTATPGYVSCLVGQDVYSENGAVVLLEKGTKVLGEYRSAMRQGQRRLFVLWTRAVTPGGVAIGLASPASDGLGRGGFDGVIDSHFWKRFGGALLLSIVDDGAAALGSRYDANGAVIRVPSDAASVALQNSINIPPSLRKPQGSQVAIFAAQDFDFSGVYGLRAR